MQKKRLIINDFFFSTINVANKSLFKIFKRYASIFSGTCNSFFSHVWIIKIFSSAWFFKLKLSKMNIKMEFFFQTKNSSTLVMPTPTTKTRFRALFIFKCSSMNQMITRNQVYLASIVFISLR